MPRLTFSPIARPLCTGRAKATQVLIKLRVYTVGHAKGDETLLPTLVTARKTVGSSTTTSSYMVQLNNSENRAFSDFLARHTMTDAGFPKAGFVVRQDEDGLRQHVTQGETDEAASASVTAVFDLVQVDDDAPPAAMGGAGGS